MISVISYVAMYVRVDPLALLLLEKIDVKLGTWYG